MTPIITLTRIAVGLVEVVKLGSWFIFRALISTITYHTKLIQFGVGDGKGAMLPPGL